MQDNEEEPSMDSKPNASEEEVNIFLTAIIENFEDNYRKCPSRP